MTGAVGIHHGAGHSLASRNGGPHQNYVTGTRSATSYAGCTQKVRVRPNSTHTLNASVRGPYVFVGASGAGGESAATWSNGSDWNALLLQVTTGPDTTELTVYFHGWYEQAPYSVHWMSFVGPGVPPNPCGEPSTQTQGPGSTSPSPSASCGRTYFP